MKFTRHIVLAVILSSAFVLSGCSVKKEEPVITVGNHDISQEEFDMYCEIVKKDMVERNDTEKVREQAAQYAAECYSLFHIAQECGAEDAFSFETFCEELQQKNEENEEKMSNGEAVMGLVEFEQIDYFEYVLAEYRQKTAEKLCESPDEEMIAAAEQYYEEHTNDYIADAQYEYQVTRVVDGKIETEIKTTDYQTLTQSYHSTDMLGDILLSGNIGEEYQVGDETIILLIRDVTCFTFEEAEDVVVQDYVTNQYLPEKIEKAAGQMEKTFHESSD